MLHEWLPLFDKDYSYNEPGQKYRYMAFIIIGILPILLALFIFISLVTPKLGWKQVAVTGYPSSEICQYSNRFSSEFGGKKTHNAYDYTYSVNGNTYTKTGSCTQTSTLIYNPANPKDSSTESISFYIIICIPFLLIGALFLGLGIKGRRFYQKQMDTLKQAERENHEKYSLKAVAKAKALENKKHHTKH